MKLLVSEGMTIAGIDNIRMIHKKQIIGANDKASAFEDFAALMAA